MTSDDFRWRRILPHRDAGHPSQRDDVQPAPITRPAPTEPSLADHAAELERRYTAVADRLAPAVKTMLGDVVNAVVSDVESGFADEETEQLANLAEAELRRAEGRA